MFQMTAFGGRISSIFSSYESDCGRYASRLQQEARRSGKSILFYSGVGNNAKRNANLYFLMFPTDRFQSTGRREQFLK